jgi:hypothetical protein
MSALMIAELEARASAVDSVLALARVRMERQGAMVRGGFYLCQGRYHFMKLVSALEAHSDDLRGYDLDEIADALDAATRRFGPGVRVESGKPQLFEDLVRSHAVRLFNDLHELVAQLHERSATMKMNALASRMSSMRSVSSAPSVSSTS